ncbi:MAG: hypothetical protein AB7O59_03015 [Pirellulales bacterium]
MPMTPCALLPRVCVLAFPATTSDANAETSGDQTPVAHSCCREAAPRCDLAEGDAQTHPQPDKPCPRGCCRLVPIAPTVDKVVVAHSPLVTDYVPCLADAVGEWNLAPAQEPQLAAETLHALSCLWRC